MNHQTRWWINLSVQAGSILILAVGLALVNPWLGGISGVLLMAVAVFYLVRNTPWMPHLLLFACTMGAVLGIWLKAPPLLMIGSVALALAGWELSENTLSRKYAKTPFELDYQKRFYLVLSAVILGSLLLVGALLLVKVPIPFVILFAAGVIILFSLFRLYRIFKR